MPPTRRSRRSSSKKTASRHREIISEEEKENAPPPPVSRLPPELEAIMVSESSSPVYPALKGTHQPSWECPDTAIMRWHRFCLDDLVREILDAYRVVCRRCGGICKLCMKSPYDWYHWGKHRSVCLGRGPVKLAVQRRGLKKRGAFKPLLPADTEPQNALDLADDSDTLSVPEIATLASDSSDLLEEEDTLVEDATSGASEINDERSPSIVVLPRSDFGNVHRSTASCAHEEAAITLVDISRRGINWGQHANGQASRGFSALIQDLVRSGEVAPTPPDTLRVLRDRTMKKVQSTNRTRRRTLAAYVHEAPTVPVATEQRRMVLRPRATDGLVQRVTCTRSNRRASA